MYGTYLFVLCVLISCAYMHCIELCMTWRQETIVLFPGLAFLMVKLGGGGGGGGGGAKRLSMCRKCGAPTDSQRGSAPPPTSTHFFGNLYNFAILDTIFRNLGRKCSI